MDRTHPPLLQRQLALLLTGLLIGCITPARPQPDPLPPARPTPAELPPPPPPPPPPPVVTPLPTVTPLPWVNPLRCLTVCAADPPTELVTVSEQGELDPRGRHRLLKAVQPALQKLLDAAHRAGHAIRIESAFRSYDAQARLFATIKEPGRAARPGHSEHQLGSTIDLRLPTSAAIDWLAGHAADFAFARSYPPHKQRLTGYRPEPWHIRYVGAELAAELHHSGLTLEELFRARPSLGESGSCADCPLPASQQPCGEVTSHGSCHGSVLSWCYDGALATVDCAVSADRCGQREPSPDFDCLPPEPAP